ncbi:hypothetical protein SAMN05192574_105358 [Mucilaginibacter gossypiicola]|uniref:Uncharacterized protein n=1 Tax=Mucilaginibacter gossypiicola TaxID=551995 RepID=A0A1H8M2A5_9SPHI|nr:hypothetical protein [Mucilaginibacter gossypiicola]SEO11512.1 hypothetical protein SAMN05192574_105358 [Mucilaginibacter gossypiicola]
MTLNIKSFLIICAFTATFWSTKYGTRTRSITRRPSITIYSGDCLKYKLDIVPPRNIRRRELGHAFAKIIINQSTKHMTFYYDGKLVFSTDNLLSYADNERGGEGFDGDNGVSAFRLIAERLFRIHHDNPFTRANDNDIGYEYLINNYTVN